MGKTTKHLPVFIGELLSTLAYISNEARKNAIILSDLSNARIDIGTYTSYRSFKVYTFVRMYVCKQVWARRVYDDRRTTRLDENLGKFDFPQRLTGKSSRASGYMRFDFFFFYNIAKRREIP